MTNKIILIISCIPAIIYVTMWFWIQALIKKRISSKIERGKYKRVFNAYFKAVFNPLLLIVPLIPLIVFFNEEALIVKAVAIVNCFVVLATTAHAYFIFPRFRNNYNNLKSLRGSELLNSIKDEEV